jgi:hypothetical protein
MIWGEDATSAGVRGLRPSGVLGPPAVLEGGCWLRRRPDRCVGGIGSSSWVGVGRGVRSGHDVGASRNAGGGYRGSCSALLVCDQGGQYADDGHGDHQENQQEFIRTCPKRMHLTPPVRSPQKTNQIHSKI